jgi:hypothetical protein
MGDNSAAEATGIQLKPGNAGLLGYVAYVPITICLFHFLILEPHRFIGYPLSYMSIEINISLS